jgi:hypothetical protein
MNTSSQKSVYSICKGKVSVLIDSEIKQKKALRVLRKRHQKLGINFELLNGSIWYLAFYDNIGWCEARCNSNHKVISIELLDKLLGSENIDVTTEQSKIFALHEVLDTTYSKEEGQICYIGKKSDCDAFVEQQGKENAFKYEVSPIYTTQKSTGIGKVEVYSEISVEDKCISRHPINDAKKAKELVDLALKGIFISTHTNSIYFIISIHMLCVEFDVNIEFFLDGKSLGSDYEPITDDFKKSAEYIHELCPKQTKSE